jgi:hypothetical protein
MTMKDDLLLGRLLGRHETLTAIAGRCTAEQVVAMREVREKKLYEGESKDFGEFCLKHFRTSKDNANRLIRLLDEFGPKYFLVAQFTRLSPATYRALAPAIEGDKLNHNGEAIALIPENAGKVAAAVAEIRKTITIKPVADPDPPKPPEPPGDPIPPVEAKCNETLAAIERVIALRTHSAQIRATVCYLRTRLNRIEMTI